VVWRRGHDREKTVMQKVSPFLWFDTQAEEAATFYVSLFDNSAITGVTRQGGAAGIRWETPCP
jgi:predicted 3-demethylubiquinone-9 3-methyltransferase (glyoxalase superfamily)